MRYLKFFEKFVDDYQELEVKTSSIPGAGKGLFTQVDIDEGSEIAEFTGKVITDSEAQELSGERSHYLIARSDGNLLDVYESDSPAIRANDAHDTQFNNNSEIIEDDNGRIWLVATRDIYAGEEIFCEYGQEYWNNWSND